MRKVADNKRTKLNYRKYLFFLTQFSSLVSMCITLKKRLPFPSKKNVSFVPYNLRYLLSLSDRTVGVFLFSSFIFLELRHFCILVRVNWYPGAILHGTVCKYWLYFVDTLLWFIWSLGSAKIVSNRGPEGSTNQAYPSCF